MSPAQEAIHSIASSTGVALPALPRLSPRLRLHCESTPRRWILRSPESTVQLNDSAAEILRRCDGRHTVADIVSELEALFDTQGIAPQVCALIAEGTRRGWLD